MSGQVGTAPKVENSCWRWLRGGEAVVQKQPVARVSPSSGGCCERLGQGWAWKSEDDGHLQSLQHLSHLVLE